MIVKLIIHDDNQAISIWNKEGDRLYYSDKPADIKTAENLLMSGKTGYFGAYWLKGIVQLMKRKTGYSW